jgi:glycerate-2-kinase
LASRVIGTVKPLPQPAHEIAGQSIILSAAPALAAFDTFPLFHAIGDAIMTGPTGNNVRDLRILLAY